MIDDFQTKVQKQNKYVIILILIALLSSFLVSRIVTAPDFNQAIIESLDNKKVTVMKLSATAVASSTALSFLPGDAAIPIANQIAELTPYFIVILGAILLEKILISVVGYLVFKFIIPFACLLGLAFLFTKKAVLKNLAIKLAIFGIILFIAIPASVYISDLIYETYETSVEQTIETANENKEYIEEKKNDLYEEDKNWMEKIEGYVSNLTSKIGNNISEMIKKGEDTLSSFLDAIAVLIITSCVIPIVVILIFVWVIKILFSFEFTSHKQVFEQKDWDI